MSMRSAAQLPVPTLLKQIPTELSESTLTDENQIDSLSKVITPERNNSRKSIA